MAIVVDWNEKCGEATFCRSLVDGDYVYTLDLYVGNAFLVMIDGNGEEKTLNCFFLDEGHMERCLKNGIFNGSDKMTAITINKAKCRNYKKIVTLLAEYMDDIDISVYKEGEQNWKEWRIVEAIPDLRMKEFAEQAISYLNDNDLIDDFVEDRDIDFSEKEKEYFGII